MSRKADKPICAICDNSVVQDYRPFCSKRCADIDLNRWLSGVYVLEGAEDVSDPTGMADESDTDILPDRTSLLH